MQGKTSLSKVAPWKKHLNASSLLLRMSRKEKLAAIVKEAGEVLDIVGKIQDGQATSDSDSVQGHDYEKWGRTSGNKNEDVGLGGRKGKKRIEEFYKSIVQAAAEIEEEGQEEAGQRQGSVSSKKDQEGAAQGCYGQTDKDGAEVDFVDSGFLYGDLVPCVDMELLNRWECAKKEEIDQLVELDLIGINRATSMKNDLLKNISLQDLALKISKFHKSKLSFAFSSRSLTRLNFTCDFHPGVNVPEYFRLHGALPWEPISGNEYFLFPFVGDHCPRMKEIDVDIRRHVKRSDAKKFRNIALFFLRRRRYIDITWLQRMQKHVRDYELGCCSEINPSKAMDMLVRANREAQMLEEGLRREADGDQDLVEMLMGKYDEVEKIVALGLIDADRARGMKRDLLKQSCKSDFAKHLAALPEGNSSFTTFLRFLAPP